jgi:hypothetical protein
MVQSSTKRRCDIQGVWTHSNSLVVCTGPTPLRRHDNHSEQRRNKYGDIRSPCRIPLIDLKLFNKSPLNLLLKEIDVTHLIINDTKFG